MTNPAGVRTLFVPGLRDHVADHWQTHLAAEIPGAITVEPLTENRLCRRARVAALDAALAGIDEEIVLVAHSAGVLMTVFWDMLPTRRIRAALLVTPADVEQRLPAGYPDLEDLDAHGWLPIPRMPLSFPAVVVASRNDPLAAFEKVAGLAACWGARLHDAGHVGHLNPASGYGPWPEGMSLWSELLRETR